MPSMNDQRGHSVGGLSDSSDSPSSEDSTSVKLRRMGTRTTLPKRPMFQSDDNDDDDDSSSGSEMLFPKSKPKKSPNRLAARLLGRTSSPRRRKSSQSASLLSSPVLRECNSASKPPPPPRRAAPKSRMDSQSKYFSSSRQTDDVDHDDDDDDDLWNCLDDDNFFTVPSSSKKKEKRREKENKRLIQRAQPTSEVANLYKATKQANSPEPRLQERDDDTDKEGSVMMEEDTCDILPDDDDDDDDDLKENAPPFEEEQDETQGGIELDPTAEAETEQPVFQDTNSSGNEEAEEEGWLENLVSEQLAQVDREMGLGDQPAMAPLDEGADPDFNEQLIEEAFGFVSSETSGNNHQSVLELKKAPTAAALPQALRAPGIHMVERHSEVDPSLYAPEEVDESLEPIVHTFDAKIQPIQQRKRVPVAQVFDRHPSIAKFFTFAQFNHLQSVLSNMIANSDDNIVCSAPTGAGKTAIFEMAMARLFTDEMEQHGRFTHQRKIMYLAPSKALCEERFEDWSTRLLSLNLHVASITGDGDPSEAHREIAEAHVIVTTPEKWDSLTRRWTEKFYLFACVKLVLVDECHLLADASRGACLEALLLRLKTIQRAAASVQTSQSTIDVSSYSNTTPQAIAAPMRMVAVSATLPNIDEIAKFLGAHEAFVFDGSYRPVPLSTRVIGLGFAGNEGKQFHFWNNLDKEVANIVHKFSNRRPSIVFCHSKAETERLADSLASQGLAKRKTNHEVAGKTRLQKLQKVLLAGIAFHHAGLELDDRRVVESSFLAGKISILCATSTLAMGVNLPAGLVVIKGTKAWRGKSGYQDLDQATVLQMIGRAGRPGFDTSGTAVIMTDNASKPVFEKLVTCGLDPAKSQIMQKLDDFIVAEISQRVVADLLGFANWLKGTLFYIQYSRCKKFQSNDHDAMTLDDEVLQTCSDSLLRLEAIRVVRVEHGQCFPTEAAHIYAGNMVDYATMGLFQKLPFDATQAQVLRAISEIEGLQKPCRRSEKKFLNAFHKDIKHKLEGPPSKVRVQQPWEKRCHPY